MGMVDTLKIIMLTNFGNRWQTENDDGDNSWEWLTNLNQNGDNYWDLMKNWKW